MPRNLHTCSARFSPTLYPSSLPASSYSAEVCVSLCFTYVPFPCARLVLLIADCVLIPPCTDLVLMPQSPPSKSIWPFMPLVHVRAAIPLGRHGHGQGRTHGPIRVRPCGLSCADLSAYALSCSASTTLVSRPISILITPRSCLAPRQHPHLEGHCPHLALCLILVPPRTLRRHPRPPIEFVCVMSNSLMVV